MAILNACSALHPEANYVGNTLYVKEGNDAASHFIVYRADHSCEIVFATVRYTCTYAVKADQVCLTAIRPGSSAAATHCHPFERHRTAGEEWEGFDNGPVHYRLVPGQTGFVAN